MKGRGEEGRRGTSWSVAVAVARGGLRRANRPRWRKGVVGGSGEVVLSLGFFAFCYFDFGQKRWFRVRCLGWAGLEGLPGGERCGSGYERSAGGGREGGDPPNPRADIRPLDHEVFPPPASRVSHGTSTRPTRTVPLSPERGPFHPPGWVRRASRQLPAE